MARHNLNRGPHCPLATRFRCCATILRLARPWKVTHCEIVVAMKWDRWRLAASAEVAVLARHARLTSNQVVVLHCSLRNEQSCLISVSTMRRRLRLPALHNLETREDVRFRAELVIVAKGDIIHGRFVRSVDGRLRTPKTKLPHHSAAQGDDASKRTDEGFSPELHGAKLQHHSRRLYRLDRSEVWLHNPARRGFHG